MCAVEFLEILKTCIYKRGSNWINKYEYPNMTIKWIFHLVKTKMNTSWIWRNKGEYSKLNNNISTIMKNGVWEWYTHPVITIVIHILWKSRSHLPQWFHLLFFVPYLFNILSLEPFWPWIPNSYLFNFMLRKDNKLRCRLDPYEGRFWSTKLIFG